MSAAGYDLMIRGAEVLTLQGLARLDVAVSGGRIAALLSPGEGSADTTIDATGQHLLPGAIDIHCHIRAPAFPHRGTVESETRAAAAGGITTLFEMPISKPCCNSAERVIIRRDHFAEHALVNFGLYAAPGSLADADLKAMVDSGIVAFKVFTTPMPKGREDEFAGLAYPDEADQLMVLQAAAKTDLPVVVHAESAELLAHFEAKAALLDQSLATTHNAARPPICESVAVAKLLAMNIIAKAKLHIAHVTSAETVDVLRHFAGTSDFSAETCPHYLIRTVEDVQTAGVFAKINPPVRDARHQAALWQAISDGVITHVTTDHASFSHAEKYASKDHFIASPAGAPGLEILVPMMLNAVAEGRVDLAQAVELISTNGAKRFGLAQSKGQIAVGFDADLMLVDLAAETKVNGPDLFTHAREVAQLYQGMRFTGRVTGTIVAGRLVFRHGTIDGVPGWGQYTVPDARTASAHPA